MMNIEGYEIPNNLEELTIGQFDKLNALEMDKELSSLERWLNKFVYLGVPEDVFDDYDFKAMSDVIAEWNTGFDMEQDKVTELTIDGFEFEARENISAKDMSLIEKAWKGTKQNFASESIAILFKRKDLSRSEHYSKAHIQHKMNLFKDQPAKIAVPYLADIQNVVLESTEEVLNDSE